MVFWAAWQLCASLNDVVYNQAGQSVSHTGFRQCLQLFLNCRKFSFKPIHTVLQGILINRTHDWSRSRTPAIAPCPAGCLTSSPAALSAHSHGIWPSCKPLGRIGTAWAVASSSTCQWPLVHGAFLIKSRHDIASFCWC